MSIREDFSLRAARQYLQSIVFVDDEIYQSNGYPREPLNELPSLKGPFGPKAEVERDKDAVDEATVPYHPKQLVQSFAREGMVCALYEPAEGFSTDRDSELFRLCERADVSILDWDLFGENGNNILPLIAQLTSESQSQVPHHVRLCVIYTLKPDLEKVASRVFDALLVAGQDCSVRDSCRIDAGTTRIVVLGKPGAPTRPDEFKDREVKETDLAQRVIKEFAEMNSGVLSAYALHGLSSIRLNTRRILDKFHAEMDGAFFVHRSLVIGSEDAFDQLPELLAEEVLAVIQDQKVDSSRLSTLTAEVANSLPLDNKKLTFSQKNGKVSRSQEEIAREFLARGLDVLKAELGVKHIRSAVKSIHAALGCDQTNGHKRLAALYNVRTRYVAPGEMPTLGFGSIVCALVKGDDGMLQKEYSFCLMPICDSIRLKNGKETSFPFWRLEAEVSAGEPARGIVIRLVDGSFAELTAKGKPRENLWMQSFASEGGGCVIAKQVNDRAVFSGPVELEWVAQLKPAHAQRVAHDIGQSFSRVGVVEAEWVRLICDGAGE